MLVYESDYYYYYFNSSCTVPNMTCTKIMTYVCQGIGNKVNFSKDVLKFDIFKDVASFLMSQVTDLSLQGIENLPVIQ